MFLPMLARHFGKKRKTTLRVDKGKKTKENLEL